MLAICTLRLVLFIVDWLIDRLIDPNNQLPSRYARVRVLLHWIYPCDRIDADVTTGYKLTSL